MSKIVVKEDRPTVNIKTTDSRKSSTRGYAWWKAAKTDLADQLVATAAFLKETQQYRYRQASIYTRMYSNLPLSNFIGAQLGKTQQSSNLPADRPTMNVVQSCIDTLVSRLTQSKPKPTFLTDGGNYKQRKIAKQLNQFILGEFYQTRAYEKGERTLQDSCVLGTGVLKVFEQDGKVAVERVLHTELYVDINDSYYGSPRSMYQLKLVDRSVVKAMFENKQKMADMSEQAFPDNSADNSKTMSDQIMLVEGWHLPSSANANDGKHVIACSAGVLFEEEYKKDRFPFVFMHYSPRLVGLWAQGISEQLTGTQVEINKLLITISKSMALVGVPRVYIEDGSKVVKAHFNDQIGSMITYRGTKPDIETAASANGDLYAHLERLVGYAFQQCGISALSAGAQKPAGLNSGEAIRTYDDLQSDRFATISKRYEQFYMDLAHLIIDLAQTMAERDGKYSTVYPAKDCTQVVDLPQIKREENPFIIQCFDESSLPKDPAGRRQRVVEDMQAGLLTPQEGRRLLNYPDLEQVNKLEEAAEERILQILDNMIESESDYTPPDPFMDLQLALKLCTQYYNLYERCGLPEKRANNLRTFHAQVLALIQASMPPPPPAGGPTGVPGAPPTAEKLPTVPQPQ